MLAPVYEAARDLQRVCAGEGWPFCFIGGLAVLRWGEPRMTDDADITVFTDFTDEEAYIDRLLQYFRPRMHGAGAFALQARVLLLQHTNGVPIDVALGGVPFERRTVERSSMWRAKAECDLRTCCAEDLIVHKAFAGRPLDWGDVEGIIRRQGEKLNVPLIVLEAEPLLALKEEPEIFPELRRLLKKYDLLHGS